MQQLTYIRKNKLEWREAPEPQLQTDLSAIVRPFVAARCDGDASFLFHNLETPLRLGVCLHLLDPMLKQFPFRGPFPYGHECIAEVLSVGAAVKQISVGQKVIVPWAISCGVCARCKAGLTSKCLVNTRAEVEGYGFGAATGSWGGMVCDLFRVPFADGMLVPVPEGVNPLHIASASDNIPDGWRTVAPHLKKNPGASVLVVNGGAKSIGLYAAGIAKAMGAEIVDYVDTNNTRLDIAQSMGVSPFKVSKTDKWFRKGSPPLTGGYEITVDASNYQRGLNFAVRSLAPGGVCTSVGFYFRAGTPFPLWQMYLNDSTFHIGVSHSRASLPEVLQLIKKGKFQPQKITTCLASWADSQSAFLEKSTKVVVHRSPVVL